MAGRGPWKGVLRSIRRPDADYRNRPFEFHAVQPGRTPIDGDPWALVKLNEEVYSRIGRGDRELDDAVRRAERYERNPDQDDR